MAERKNNRKIEEKLGFDKIRYSVSERCSTEYAKKRALTESFSSDTDKILGRLILAEEMKTIIMFEPSFPSSGYVDSMDFLKPLETGSTYLTIESLILLRKSEETLGSILNFFNSSKEGSYPKLKELSSGIVSFPEIRRRLDSILDRFGEIKDNASQELFKIRFSIREKEASVSKKTEAILKMAQAQGIAEEGSTVSIRDGKMLIPVAAANKKKIPGFVLDESASGKTVFIEPAEVVELGNQIKELKFAEQREILRILIEFSDFLRPYLPELIQAAVFMGEIDFIHAKASVATMMNAGRPIISDCGELKLFKARHPILETSLKRENKEIVPLTLSLDRKKHILLISGPNAGGKSVCLKTAGLLQYMFQCGLLIPASENSELMIFDEIFIDIGDEQSIENDLSTYSSHLINMRDMLERANEKSLVLIDEFGSGTEPAAGGAIAEAILEEIESRGTYGIITTHYTNLKFFAEKSNGVINGAMLFDVQNIRPLFKLETGLPGNSFAFELARKTGLPEKIVKIAEEKAGSGFIEIERNLRKIARSRKDLDYKLSKIKNTDKILENITDKYQKELSDIQSRRKSIIEEAKREAGEILSEANRRIEHTIKEIRESQAEKERTKELRRSLKEFEGNLLEKSRNDEEDFIRKKMESLQKRQKKREERRLAKGESGSDETSVNKKDTVEDSVIRKGDNVRIKGNGMVGEVLSVDGKKITVSIGTIKSIMDTDKVEKISRNEYNRNLKKEKAGSSGTYNDFGISERRLNFKSSIDIRGYRLNDALDTVSKLIDDALMFGIGQVKILHGKGNGILKEEIRKYLRTFPGVISCRDEDLELGGSGITVVQLEN